MRDAASDSTIAGRRVTAPAPPPAGAPQNPPRLSVVITYYKGADVICDAVRSVLAQTVAPHEIVICDDGSPDDLLAALGPLREHVEIVRKENGGTGSALNAAMRAASGDYVVQLDQDDAFAPQRIEAIAAVLAARPDLDIVATDALIELGSRQVTTLSAIDPYPASDQRAAMIATCTFLWPTIRRSLLLESGGWDESFKVVEDWGCALRLVLDGARVGYVHEPLYRWRLTPGSRSSSNRAAHFEDQVHLTENALAHPSLSAEERAGAQSLLTARRRSLAREQARRSLELHEPDARRRSLTLVTGDGFDRATRVKAAVAVLSPSLARRFISRRREHNDPAYEALAERGFRLPG
ncbi:MAG TPA: glycosyltransferase family A protein [Solirubrobacteraceae bacterium]|jgi:cellulose synthase/poly-beta-1,6-N-acetylglucosamine synthase-like glycosyltransferase|nr:glycosyltransferase family A protein [Solirubrobacteraceae bacterium]